MIADSAFAIGKRHEVCQDYARAETGGKWTRAWVSDGCSSSPDSDVGARLLVLSAERVLEPALGRSLNDPKTSCPDDIGTWGIQEAGMTAGFLDLRSEVLDATLLYAVCDGERVCLSAFGDGVMFLRWVGGATRCLDIELTHGYPDYLSYRLDKTRRDKYDATMKTAKGRKVIRGHVDLEELEPHQAYAEMYELVQGDARLELAAVMSDGVRSFYRKTENGASEPIPLDEVLKDLLDFKLHSGRFVQRRLNRFLKDATAKGWEHHDDIAIAAIHFGE